MSEPRFVQRESFRVLGVVDDAYKIDEVDPGFTDLWMKRFMAHHDSVAVHSVDGCYYGVWIGTLGTDISVGIYLAGMAVDDQAVAPDGWVIRVVPKALYAVFDTNLRDVGDATEHALDVWLPQSDWELAPTPRIDLMPPDTKSQETPVTVWVPVRKRSSC